MVQAMPNKIDDLFAPERLRRNWQKEKKRTGGPVSAETEGKSPLEIFARLQVLIKERFSGDDAVALNLLLEELHALLIPLFPTVEKSQIPAENQAEMTPFIHEVMNRIEDLVEAFEIAGRSR
jgi:hypothetical protein